MVISTLSPSFNLSIPKVIRLALNLQPGDALEFFVQEDGTIVLKKEVVYSHNTPQIAFQAVEWVFEDDIDEEEEEEEECVAVATIQSLSRTDNPEKVQ